MSQNPGPKIQWFGGGEKMYNRCVVGLDRDGVINVDRGTYTWKNDDFEPIPGSLQAIATIKELGHKVVIITNQGGIEKGLFTTDDVDSVHDYMFQLLDQAGCSSIDALYYSSSNRKDDAYAKPNTGMFDRCEKENPEIKFNQGYFVGDKITDLEAAAAIGARPILVRTGYGIQTEADLNNYAHRELKKKTLVFDDLKSFVETL